LRGRSEGGGKIADGEHKARTKRIPDLVCGKSLVIDLLCVAVSLLKLPLLGSWLLRHFASLSHNLSLNLRQSGLLEILEKEEEQSSGCVFHRAPVAPPNAPNSVTVSSCKYQAR